MDSTSDKSRSTTPLTRSAADIAADLTPERQAAHEAAYRRGLHQGLAFAGDLVDEATTLNQARSMLCKAENLAGELRYKRKAEGNGALIDHMRSVLSRRRGGTKQ